MTTAKAVYLSAHEAVNERRLADVGVAAAAERQHAVTERLVRVVLARVLLQLHARLHQRLATRHLVRQPLVPAAQVDCQGCNQK